ncbi:MAG: TRIC cation channel family protein [Actinomycetales bacterium]|nr:TRIC cation channel family protein [Actinomycetales bacterium]
MPDLSTALLILTFVGLAAFALSGAVAGARVGMDWLGLSTLAAVTAIGGGTLRDLLMTRTPGWLIDFWPTVIVIAMSVISVWIVARLAPVSGQRSWMVHVFSATDAVGLATFTVVGTDLAIKAGFTAGPAVVLGVISGIGGGVIRDVIAGRRVAIFTGEVYALAAAAGAIAFVITQPMPQWVPVVLGLTVTLTIRLGAIALGWRVPTLALPQEPGEKPVRTTEDSS